MVFKFATFDPAQDPNDFNPAFPPTPSSSPSVTLCQPCEYTCTFTRALVGRLAAGGASLVLTAPAVEVNGREIRDQSAETPILDVNFDVHPEFHQRQLKEFTLQELKVATLNFSNMKLIGRGGFGHVYEGRLADGTPVAIKRRGERSPHCALEFEREVMVGSIISPHHNLLPLLGFCRASNCEELLLVYPLMINRSVTSCLRERPETQPPLDWPTRIKIATGSARGLSHLHDLHIVHRDIKAANILLDEEFEPHIGDFGLGKFIPRRQGGYSVDCIEEASMLPRTEAEEEEGSQSENCDDTTVTTKLCGTFGHIAPEYVSTGKCSVKNDVFSFGIMLLEILSGQRASVLARLANDAGMGLLGWVKALLVKYRWDLLVDHDLEGKYDEEIKKVIQLALFCTQSDPRERPSMAQVVRILEGHSIEERWEEYRSRPEILMHCHNPYTDRVVVDSSTFLDPEELSGPR